MAEASRRAVSAPYAHFADREAAGRRARVATPSRASCCPGWTPARTRPPGWPPWPAATSGSPPATGPCSRCSPGRHGQGPVPRDRGGRADALAACVTALSGADDLATAVDYDGDFGQGPAAVDEAADRAARATLALIRGRQGLRPGRRPAAGWGVGRPRLGPPHDTGRASVQKCGGTDALLAARLARPAMTRRWRRPSTSWRHSTTARPVRTRPGQRGSRMSSRTSSSRWTMQDGYDPAIGKLRTYLTVLARHRAVDVVRSKLRRRVARQERRYRLTPSRPDSTPHDEVADAQAAQCGAQRAGCLPDEQRHVVELAYLQGPDLPRGRAGGGHPEQAKSPLRLALAKLEAVLDYEPPGSRRRHARRRRSAGPWTPRAATGPAPRMCPTPVEAFSRSGHAFHAHRAERRTVAQAACRAW